MKHVFPALVFVGSVFLPVGLLNDNNLGSLLVTFFGILSAGIIPALSLLVSSTLSSSLSVLRLDELHSAVASLVGKLLQTLAYLVVGAAAIFVSEVGVPKLPSNVGEWLVPTELIDAPERLIQALVFTAFVIGVDRLRLVAAAFKAVLQRKYELTKLDSEKRVKINSGRVGSPEAYFAKSGDFGAEVRAEETLE